MTRRENLIRTWLGLWGWGFAAYTVLGIMGGIQDEVFAIREHVAFRWFEVLGSNLIGHWGNALFVPPVVLLVRRFPLDGTHWRRSMPAVLLGTVALFFVMRFGVEQLELMFLTTRLFRLSSFVNNIYNL